jgi:ribosome maturation factor RimP
MSGPAAAENGTRGGASVTSVADRVARVVAPTVESLGLELYDVEHAGGSVRVLVDRDGGVDLDAITAATRAVSRALDDADPIEGRYTLEVSSPGVERTLRTVAHFRTAAERNETVRVKTARGVEGDRRLEGTVAAVDDRGVTVRLADGTERALRYDEIERARTVFEWGPAPRPGKKEKTR